MTNAIANTIDRIVAWASALTAQQVPDDIPFHRNRLFAGSAPLQWRIKIFRTASLRLAHDHTCM